MDELPFNIPKRDDDLFVVSEHSFFVTRADLITDVEELHEIIDELSYSLFRKNWENLRSIFIVGFSLIKDLEWKLGNFRHRIVVLHTLKRGFRYFRNDLVSVANELSEESETTDEINEMIKNLKDAFPMFLYLMCKLLITMDPKRPADSGVTSAKKKKTAVGATQSIIEQYYALRTQCLQSFSEVFVTSVGNKPLLSFLYSSGRLPENIDRTLAQLYCTLLSDADNASARSEIRTAYDSIFELIGFYNFHWRSNCIVSGLLDSMPRWEYYKRIQTFHFVPIIVKTNFKDHLLNTMFHRFLSKQNVADTAKIIGLFLTSVAASYPDFMVKKFTECRDFLESSSIYIRNAMIVVMESIIIQHCMNDTIRDNQNAIKMMMRELRIALTDKNSTTKVKAANLVAHIFSEQYLEQNRTDAADGLNRRFPIEQYGYGFIRHLTQFFNEDSVTVRKAGLSALNEILAWNPFGSMLEADLLQANYRKAHAAYIEAAAALKKAEENNPAENRAVLLCGFLAELKEFLPEFLETEKLSITTQTKSAADETYETLNKYVIGLHNVPDESETKKCFAFECLRFVCNHIEVDPSSPDDTLQNIEEFVNKVWNENTNKEILSYENQLIILKESVKTTQHDVHYVLCKLQFTLEMEMAMNAAIPILQNQGTELNDVVKFLSTCRMFRLRKSESAVIQICTLLYQNDDAIRSSIIAAAIDIFFSKNTDSKINSVSTVQNLLQMIDKADRQDRVTFCDALVHILRTKPLSAGSMLFLWNCLSSSDDTRVLLALQLLRCCAIADPKTIYPNFRRLIDLFSQNRPITESDEVQVAVLAVIAGIGEAPFFAASTHSESKSIKDVMARPFRLPLNHKFFETAATQLAERLILDPHLGTDYEKSGARLWRMRAHFTLKAVYTVCVSPDTFVVELMAPILEKCKVLNSERRGLRFLWLQSAAALRSICTRITAQQNKRMAFKYANNKVSANVFDIDDVTEGLQNVTIDDERSALDTTIDGLNLSMQVAQIDTRVPTMLKKFKRMRDKNRYRGQLRTTRGWMPGKKWRKSGSCVSLLQKLLKSGVRSKPTEVSVTRLTAVTNECFLFYKEMRKATWLYTTVVRRMMLLAREYVSRMLEQANEASTRGYNRVSEGLQFVRKVRENEKRLVQVFRFEDGKQLTAFERENLNQWSIFATANDRLTEVTAQTDTIISRHQDAALHWDCFHLGSILSRILPIAMCHIRFRNVGYHSVNTSDDAVFCVLKIMALSPNLCRRWLCFMYHYQRLASPETRATMHAMLSDLATRHPSTFSTRLSTFILLIHDYQPDVRYHSLLIVHHLYSMKVIQLSDRDRGSIALLLIDTDPDVSKLAEEFFREIIKKSADVVPSLTKEVLHCLFRFNVTPFDFKTIMVFFVQHITLEKHCIQTMENIISFIILLSKMDHFEKHVVFAELLVWLTLALPKMNLKALNKLTQNVANFKNFFKILRFYRRMQAINKSFAQQGKNAFKSETDELSVIFDALRKEMKMMDNVDRTMAADLTTTVMPDDNVRQVPSVLVEQLECVQSESPEHVASTASSMNAVSSRRRRHEIAETDDNLLACSTRKYSRH